MKEEEPDYPASGSKRDQGSKGGSSSGGGNPAQLLQAAGAMPGLMGMDLTSMMTANPLMMLGGLGGADMQ